MQLQQTSCSCKCGSSKHSTVIKAYTKATIGFISKKLHLPCVICKICYFVTLNLSSNILYKLWHSISCLRWFEIALTTLLADSNVSNQYNAIQNNKCRNQIECASKKTFLHESLVYYKLEFVKLFFH